jgi:hypothetical protein
MSRVALRDFGKGKISMTGELESQLKRCFELLAKIRAEYPEGEFDWEMIHGDMDFRYRQIKEDREKLEAFPVAIREFARFREALTTPDAAVRSFFAALLEKPEHFSSLSALGFHERRKTLDELATDLNVLGTQLSEVLSRCRLAGILDGRYRLIEKYREVLQAYLSL